MRAERLWLVFSLPAALILDPVLGARFISHYFIKCTHFPVEDVRVAIDGNLETTRLEAGEIARPGKPKGIMTLTSRDAWDRLRRASDPPYERRSERVPSGKSALAYVISNAEPLLVC